MSKDRVAGALTEIDVLSQVMAEFDVMKREFANASAEELEEFNRCMPMQFREWRESTARARVMGRLTMLGVPSRDIHVLTSLSPETRARLLLDGKHSI